MPNQNDRIDNIILRVTNDEASLRKAQSRIDGFRDHMERVSKDTKAFGVGAKAASGGVDALGKSSATTERNIQRLRDRMRSATDQAIDLATAEKQVAKAIAEVDRASAAAGQGSRIAATTGSVTPGKRGLLGAAAQDVSQLLPSGPIQQAAGVLTGFTASVDQMGVRAALAGGGIALLTVGIGLLQQQSEAAGIEAKRQFALGLDTIELAKTSTSEELRIKQAAALERIKTEQALADASNAALAQLKQVVQNLSPFEQITLGASIISGIGDSGKQLVQAREAVDAQNAALAKAKDAYTAATNALKSHDVVVNDLAAAREKLTEAEKTAAQAVAELDKQRNALLKNEGQQTADLEEQRTIQSLREQQDFNLQREANETAHLDRLTGIDEQGQERLEELRTSGAEKLLQAESAIAKLAGGLIDIDTKLGQDRQRINSEFMRDEIADLEKFHQEEQRANARNAKERLRRIEDMNDALIAAEMNNDVVQFETTMRQGQKDLRRLAEDADETTQERQTQFEEERSLNSQRHQERLAEIEETASQRRADIQEQIAERQIAKAALIADIADQLAAEKARIQQSRIDAQTAFDEQKQREDAARALRLQRQADDESRTDLRRQTALQVALNDIEIKKQAEHAAVASLVAVVNRLDARIRSMNVDRGGGASFSSGTGTNSSYYNPISGKPTPFGYGGVINDPTIALMGERPGYGDVIRPFKKSEGPGSAFGGGGVVIHLNGDINVGDVASVSEVKRIVGGELTKMGQTIVAAKWAARTGRAA